MSDNSKIEWTDATWNPVTGCTKVSPGCDHCYALTFAERWRGTPGHYFERGFDVQLRPDKLDQPLRWKKPRRVFVNSMSDLFHADIPDDYIAKVFAVMAGAEHHTFQVLTKRPGRMRSLISSDAFRVMVKDEYAGFQLAAIQAGSRAWRDRPLVPNYWPLRNVWLGVSAEDQKWAGIRIPALLDTPAAVRFVSAEPLLGPIDLDGTAIGWWARFPDEPTGGIDWVIVGGESGRGARPMDLDWAREIRDTCQRRGVAFFYKQQGSADGPKSRRELDGRTWDEYPAGVA
jgi:protein gp37